MINTKQFPGIYMLILLGLFSCVNRVSHEVHTFSDWCNLEDSSSRPGEIGVFELVDYHDVRTDLVKLYNEMLVEEVVSLGLWDSTVHTNKDAQDLISRHELGMWIEGNTLHLANKHYAQRTLRETRERFDRLTHSDSLLRSSQVNDYQRCLYLAIDDFFEEMVIHGSGLDTARILLDFRFQNQLASESD